MSFRVVCIRGDGNCLFRSISYCVFGTEERHREVRMGVVEQVVRHWPRYKDYIIGDRSYGLSISSANDYKLLMSRDAVYGGHVELHGASEVFTDYTFRVHIYGARRTIDYGRGYLYGHLLFSGYPDSGHYSVLQ